MNFVLKVKILQTQRITYFLLQIFLEQGIFYRRKKTLKIGFDILQL